jgi:predicted AlkP superfamily phosphohydrolase/phosphomutase
VAPLVVISLDGGDSALLARWVDEGHLPNLAALMKRGSWGELGGADMKVDHGLFTCLWSGTSRGAHGYYHFRQLLPDSYTIREFSGRDFAIEPFWAALRGQDVQVAIIDAPETQPVEGLKGLQLIDWAVHEPRHEPLAIPTDLLGEARRIFGPREVIAQFPLNTTSQNRRLLKKYLARIERKGRLVRHLLGKQRFDLIVVGFGEMHTGGHQFWNYRNKPEAGDLGSGLRSIYAAIDREIGTVMALAGEAANVVVFSSVGIIDSYPTNCILETTLEELDYLARLSPKRPATPLELARHVVPDAWRKSLSYYFPKALQEHLVADSFSTTTDWSRTTAFAIPAIHSSAIRINLRGREPNGIVEPGAEYEALIERLKRDLTSLVDPVDGLPVVHEFLRTSEMFGPDHHRGMPDIFVNWRPNTRFYDQVMHGNKTWAVPAPNWFRSSFHNDKGWYAAAGPSIGARGRAETLDALELAPLFLSLLGAETSSRALEARRKVA